MITMLAGLASAFGLWWLLKLFAKSTPAQVARLARQAGGWIALAVAALLALKGRLDMAVLLASGGAWLLGWNALPWWLGGPRLAPGQAGSNSRLRSATLELTLDHRTGHVDGIVLAGLYSGRALSSLGDDDLLALRREAVRGDPEGVRLLEAYLHGRAAGWREDAQADPDARRRPDAKSTAMTEQEAYEVLGLQPGAEPEAIKRAHRTLMKRLHPDQGGSTYLASRVNQAKDVLLSRHR